VAVADDHPTSLESREPSVEDLVALCRALNERGARYMIVGGFAVRAAGYDRRTLDIDLLVDVDPENERRVIDAVATLPDGAARELTVGEIARYVVVRVADEITVDLMKSASGIAYEEAERDAVVHDVDGVAIPFASPRLLLRMKRDSYREKDALDTAFLKRLLPEDEKPT
jgi:hypothetical protein